jgi:acetoin utilization deacetylase AcuC-like enzyme
LPAAGVLAPVYSHTDCLAHDAGARHPESPARLRAVREAVSERDSAALVDVEPATLEPLLRVHPRAYLDGLAALAAQGGGRLDADTAMNAHSWRAAVGGAGAVLAAVDCAFSGRPAFAACRPPGHHALADRAMGFCLLGNAVIAAREAQVRGARRVLIVDWDVHHGNGTQALVEVDPSIHFVSMHQAPHWPFSGAAEERGCGNVWNVPMPAGLPAERYVEALWETVERAADGWAPHCLVVSSGFDSMLGDPLGGFTLEPEHYRVWVHRLRTRFPSVPLAVLLEGGYAPERVAAGVVEVASALAG